MTLDRPENIGIFIVSSQYLKFIQSHFLKLIWYHQHNAGGVKKGGCASVRTRVMSLDRSKENGNNLSINDWISENCIWRGYMPIWTGVSSSST